MTTEERIEQTAEEMLGALNVMLDHNKVRVGEDMVAVQLAPDTTDYIDGRLREFTKELVLSWYDVGTL